MGCEPVYTQQRTIDLRQRILEINDHHGGTRHRTLAHGALYYQSFGAQIEVLNGADSLKVTSIDAAPFGSIGPISDMLIASDVLYVVHAGDSVIEYDLSTPRRPAPGNVWTRDDLGLAPLELSEVDGSIWVSGRNGATSLDAPGTVFLGSYGRVGRVVKSSEGLVATAGRRVHKIEDGAYVGSASALEPAPASFGIAGGLVFVLQGSKGATVGLMGPDIRELGSVTVEGIVRRVRSFDDTLVVINDTEFILWKVGKDGTLGNARFIATKGARDVASVEANYLLVGGTFGRALYRIEQDERGKGDVFFQIERSPGHLAKAISDGRRILAGSDDGNWMYRIGSSAELSDKALLATTAPFTQVTLGWGEAGIVEDGLAVSIKPTTGAAIRWAVPHGGSIYALETADNQLWIGHDEGIAVLGFDDGRLQSVGSIVLEGPVFWLFRPRVGNDVAWVSVYGGVGSAEMVPDPNSDPSLVRRVSTEDYEREMKKMRKDASLHGIK